MKGGFFPTPYPDECYYSILCRYNARSGDRGFDSTSISLFGNLQSMTASLFLPQRIECADHWTDSMSGITRKEITINHTLYPYWVLNYSQSLRAEVDKVIDGGVTNKNIHRTMVFKSRNSWVKNIRYCPLCANEDCAEYGETYWHRKHQICGSFYCSKHHVRLIESDIPISNITSHFFAAAEANLQSDGISDIPLKFKDNFLKITNESEWLLEHGLDVKWQLNGRDKYWKLLRNKGLSSDTGHCRYSDLDSELKSYWGDEFLELLAVKIGENHFQGYDGQIEIHKLKTLKPLYHILLMCYLSGGVSEFVKSNPADNPFTEGQYKCENPVCPNHHTPVINTDVKYLNSRTIGYFQCDTCGMKYKVTRAKWSKYVKVITDYGQLWKDELVRLSQDKTVTIIKAAEILGCNVDLLIKKKHEIGLIQGTFYDVTVGPEKYYKTKVEELCKQYTEVTVKILNDNVPGAYSYLGDHCREWLYSHIVIMWDNKYYQERDLQFLGKAKEAVKRITLGGMPNRRITIGWIAAESGLTRDLLRENISTPKTREYIDSVVEKKEDWYKRRIKNLWEEITDKSKFTLNYVKRTMMIREVVFSKHKDFIEEVITQCKSN